MRRSNEEVIVRIGIIGAGNIGGTLARRFTEQGHEVVAANRRGPEAMSELLADLGDRGRAGTAEDAARFGEVVVIATPLSAWNDLPARALAGKVVVDANNYYPGRDGQIEALDSGRSTSSELLAERLPGARVVKAFNTVHYKILGAGGRPAGDPERLAAPIAGDDEQAKAEVAALADEIGFDTVDHGGLAEGRRQQPGTPVYAEPLTADGVRKRLASR
jgi:predicted dinucleotide-binding enzyme